MSRCVTLVLAMAISAAGASTQDSRPAQPRTPEAEAPAELDGHTLRMTIANPPFLPGREWRTVLTKVE
jgi:hypothetical protein